MQSVFDAFGRFITDLFTFFHDFILFFIELLRKIFESFWTMQLDIIYFFFDKFFDLLVFILGHLPSVNMPNYWSFLPPETSNFLGMIGIFEALAMIVSSLVIRFTLQLVPFTRLGS